MPAVVLAWLVGEGLVVYRVKTQTKHWPMPGQLLALSGVYVALGALASAEKARFLAAAMAWGFNVAVFLNVAPQMLSGFTSATQAAQPAGQGGKQTAGGGGKKK